MATEIERRFLVNSDDWKKEVKYVSPEECTPFTEWDGSDVIQAYFRTENEAIRIRIVYGSSAHLCIKIPVGPAERDEFEYLIPLEDAQDMIGCGKVDIIVKRRFRIIHHGLEWIVDEFLGRNNGLVIAEVELSRVDQKIDMPGWLGREITHNRRYSNMSLARFPINGWDDLYD